MPMNARLLRPRQTGFDPRSISGLALWLDASAAGSLYQDTLAATPATSATNPVGYWRDLSGNGRHATQGAANNRPTIAPTTRNNRTTIRFDGLDDFLSFTGVGMQSIFIACVCQDAGRNLNSLIGYRDPLADQGVNNSGIRRDSSPANTTTWRGLGNTNTGDFTNPAGSQFRVNGVSTNSVNDGVWHIVSALRNGSQMADINNIAGWFRVREFGGDIGEIICYTGLVTNTARDRIEKHLATRWGLTIG